MYDSGREQELSACAFVAACAVDILHDWTAARKVDHVADHASRFVDGEGGEGSME